MSDEIDLKDFKQGLKDLESDSIEAKFELGEKILSSLSHAERFAVTIWLMNIVFIDKEYREIFRNNINIADEADRTKLN